ncbi:MAG: hypothetical protein QOF91_634 [Alphaproteobacteria bacterium]|jgi:hypothetical protein|nr:hypothetical protein [Alphaproteobacteria bacterium]
MFSPMPRYFFHVKDGDTVLDTVGMELPSVEDAKAEARRVVTMFKRPDPAAPPASLVVADESGATVFILTLWT